VDLTRLNTVPLSTYAAVLWLFLWLCCVSSPYCFN
jgi:hypothetical protein